MERLLGLWNNNLTCEQREDIQIAAKVGVGFFGVVTVIAAILAFHSSIISPQAESFSPRTIKVEIPAMQDCRWEISSVQEDNRALVLACR